MNKLRYVFFIISGALLLFLLLLFLTGIHYPHMTKEFPSENRIDRGIASPLHRFMFTGVDFMYPANLDVRLPIIPSNDYLIAGAGAPETLGKAEVALRKQCSLQSEDESGVMPLFFIPLARYDFLKIIVLTCALILALLIICFVDGVIIKRLKGSSCPRQK